MQQEQEEEEVKIPIKAYHLKDRGFMSNTECPLAAAIKEIFPDKYISVGVTTVRIEPLDRPSLYPNYQIIGGYEWSDCERDAAAAVARGYNDSIIRTISLIKMR